jgi:putative ABC transport system permease protein
VLVALGIYGTLAYLVVARTAELGVRRAIGASRRDLLVLVFREGLKPVLRGIAAGIGISVIAARAIGPRLDLPPLTVAVLAGLSLFLILLTVLSSLLPALRASRVDPLIALRS